MTIDTWMDGGWQAAVDAVKKARNLVRKEEEEAERRKKEAMAAAEAAELRDRQQAIRNRMEEVRPTHRRVIVQRAKQRECEHSAETVVGDGVHFASTDA